MITLLLVDDKIAGSYGCRSSRFVFEFVMHALCFSGGGRSETIVSRADGFVYVWRGMRNVAEVRSDDLQQYLGDADWLVECVSTVDEAHRMLESGESDPPALAIVDGDLGDKKYGADGLSGSLCEALRSSGIPFARLSAYPEGIPAALQGEFCCDRADCAKVGEDIRRIVGMRG